jgi:hypothetical protein
MFFVPFLEGSFGKDNRLMPWFAFLRIPKPTDCNPWASKSVGFEKKNEAGLEPAPSLKEAVQADLALPALVVFVRGETNKLTNG